MNIIDYVASLLPSFKKNRIIDDARLSYAELETNTLPAYKEAEKIFTSWKFRSQQMKDFTNTFKRIVKSDKDANIMIAISRALSRILESRDFIQDRVEHDFESEVLADGISCRKANLLRILEAVNFVSNYSLLFINYVYILETAEVNKESGYVKSSLSLAELEYLNKNFTDFCLAIEAIGKDKDKFKKIINEIPDVMLNINTGKMTAGVLGEDKLDPLQTRGFSGVNSNPIYHLRLIYAEYQVNNFKRNQQLKKVLELRLMNLQMLVEETPDAKLEKEIDYIQGRIQGLDHKLKQMEEGA